MPNGSSPPTATTTHSTSRCEDGIRAKTRSVRSGRTSCVVRVTLLTTCWNGSPKISTKIEKLAAPSPRFVMSMARATWVPSASHRSTEISYGFGVTNLWTALPSAIPGTKSAMRRASVIQGHLRRFLTDVVVTPSGSTCRAPLVDTSAVHDEPLNHRWSYLPRGSGYQPCGLSTLARYRL